MSKARKRPTELELEILKTLWEQGPCTVRQVWEALEKRRKVGYTTILKMLQIMEEKGLVKCDRRARAHIYQAKEARKATLARLAEDVLERVFDGSMQQLLVHAFARKHVSAQEIAEIYRLLKEVEELEQKEPSNDSPHSS